MKPNKFIYADLSCYQPTETLAFYENVFDWQFQKNHMAGNNTHSAYVDGKEVASLYQMPEKFQQMGMPHFWMGYIQVNSVVDTVSIAKSLGGIIELQLDMVGFGKVALIRDPQGAGFTIYEGESITPTRTENQVNTLVWNELHVSNAKNVIPFYEEIFGWRFDAVATEHEQAHYKIVTRVGDYIADLREMPNSIKGQYEYWVVTFGVADVAATQQKIIHNGGDVVMDEGDRVMLTDNSQQAFFYITAVGSQAIEGQRETADNTGNGTQKNIPKTPLKWKAIAGLLLIVTSVLTGQYWVLGGFFLIGLIMDIRAGSTHLFETISRRDNPVLYWLIIAVWGVLSAFLFV